MERWTKWYKAIFTEWSPEDNSRGQDDYLHFGILYDFCILLIFASRSTFPDVMSLFDDFCALTYECQHLLTWSKPSLFKNAKKRTTFMTVSLPGGALAALHFVSKFL